MTILLEQGRRDLPVQRIAAHDTCIPPGTAALTVLPSDEGRAAPAGRLPPCGHRSAADRLQRGAASDARCHKVGAKRLPPSAQRNPPGGLTTVETYGIF